MGPRSEEQVKPELRGEPQPKRFRLIRLEERIAPAQGGGSKGHYACVTGYDTICGCSGGDCGTSQGGTSSCSIE
jgi:hypothetical protein